MFLAVSLNSDLGEMHRILEVIVMWKAQKKQMKFQETQRFIKLVMFPNVSYLDIFGRIYQPQAAV